VNRSLFLFVLAAMLGSTWAAQKQQVYKWTDANGVVHFTDSPPPKDTPNVQSVRMVGGTTATAPATPEPAEDKTPQGPTPSNAIPGTTAPATNADPEDAARCMTARANLELLQGDASVGIPGADGKTEPLDDKSRAAQLANAKLAVARFCK
jgi:hypothetical protein